MLRKFQPTKKDQIPKKKLRVEKRKFYNFAFSVNFTFQMFQADSHIVRVFLHSLKPWRVEIKIAKCDSYLSVVKKSYLIFNPWRNSRLQVPLLRAVKQLLASTLKHIFRTLLWLGLSHSGVDLTWTQAINAWLMTAFQEQASDKLLAYWQNKEGQFYYEIKY